MSEEKVTEPMAQLYDRFLNRSAIGMFLVALLFALSAGEQLLGDEMPTVLSYAEKALAFLIIILVAPVTFKVYWRKKTLLGTCDEPEGYLTASFQKAAMRAFTASFLVMLTLYVLYDKQVIDWSAAAVVPALLAFNMLVASGSFLFDNLSGDEDDFDDEADA